MKTEARVQSLAAERTEEAKGASAPLEQRARHGSRVNFFQGNAKCQSQFRGMMLSLTNHSQVYYFMNCLPRGSFPIDTSYLTPSQNFPLFSFTG